MAKEKSDVRDQKSGTGESRKLDDLKETVENKEAVAKAEGKVVETKKEEVKTEERESKPAVAKAGKVKKEKKVESATLTREYIVPMRKGFLNVPHYRRAKKAVKTLKEFMVRHMNVRDGDTRKVKVDITLNNEIWFRGIRKPLHKIKVEAVKRDGIVYVTLVDPSDYVKFAMARQEKARKAAEVGKEKPKKTKKEKVEADKDKDGVEDKKEEAEDKKAGTEKAVKSAKVEAKAVQHTASGKHAQKTAPVRKVLK